MKKTLRICLAMGGGVSLGSFSGSALTEALKLLILYGKGENDEPYEDVIVDGMSGASAGAIALTIMLKCLIDYHSMIPLYSNNLTEDELLNEIAADYFNNDLQIAKQHHKIEALKALQLAQKIQYKLWVDEVNSLRLYGSKVKKDYNADPNKSFALLDRELLESLTKKYLMVTDGVDISRRQLLDNNRVIFACSLTNLLPIEMDFSHKKKRKLEENVLKSVGSENHSELRVIDFVFEQDAVTDSNKDTDSRWIKFCKNPDVNNPTHFEITSKEAWSTIAASALACGAFPIAFEPVLLKRYQREFGDNEHSTWPKSFKDIQSEIKTYSINHPDTEFNYNCVFNERKENTLDYTSFNFPYIDGGTFNNEPIKEAFKIGTFQDFGRITHTPENEERLILFVDPIVRKEQYHSFKVSSFEPVKTSDNQVMFKNELSKLMGNVSGIIGVLANQGSIKEEHKMIDVKENLALRSNMFNYLNANTTMGENLSIAVIGTAFDKIEKNLNGNIISLGTRDPITYFLTEIKKSCDQQGENSNACLLITREMLESVKEQIILDRKNNTQTGIGDVFNKLNLQTPADRNAFAQIVFKVVTDFALNTGGKSKNAYRAAIMPINKKLETIELPGTEIEAFGGFASLKARKYAFEFARLSTLISLKENKEGFRPGSPFIVGQDFVALENQITKKIEAINFFNKDNPYANDLKKDLYEPSVKRIKGILLQNKFISFLLLKVPFVATSLLGTIALPITSIWLLAKSLFKKSPWRGSNLLKKFIKHSVDQVNYFSLEPVTISILSDSKLNKALLVKSSDQKITKRKTLEYKQGNRHQYFFQVYLLEYIKDNKTPDIISPNFASLKIRSELVERIGLSLSGKVKIPNHIDGNLNPTEKRKAIEQNYPESIDEMRIGRVNLPKLPLAINNISNALHYSLKNINYHVNPILEIDVNQLKKGWYFKEQTESLDKKLLS
ncbi:patatin-like phospholipase family protein [Aquimarina sp. 2201CG5-10]|uniref:patatin-like phospholipase family protein n=1 Tax=Aquimarina callyspongiae TaxID=3098150 RepID=UPI002AB39014|nr:patatin-like phospholipase family protein [Aquimarina sp. 2201CG5-10]MDY8136536.1 patatin-like phospholipase family protein [Aquimarina sp. 2201CG5-10]